MPAKALQVPNQMFEEAWMETVSIEGLPEPVAAAVVQMVEALRTQFAGAPRAHKPVELPRWPGKVLGSLTREEIHRDAG
jgi:hypothetical protein